MSNEYNGLFNYFYFMPAMPFVSLIMLFLLTFVYSGLIHVLIIAFKGKEKYSGSYNVFTYSLIPYLILSVLPLVGFFAIVYSIVLMIIGLSKVHNISKGKAVLACLLPGVLIIGAFIVLLFMALSSIY